MKNIILIVTDTFRYDNLGSRAERTVRTPQLDKFAKKRATSIEDFYTGSFPTIPHRTDLASGVLGWPHYGWQPIQQSGPNHVGEMLGEEGYATQLICDCPHLFNSGFQFDFDGAFQNRGQEGDKPLLHLNDPVKEAMPHDKTRMEPTFRGHPLVDQHRWINRYFQLEEETFPAQTGGTAVRWLEENYQAEPFFLWVDFFDPHEPWDPPEYLADRYHPEYEGRPMIHPNYGRSEDYTEEELRNLWAHYAAEAELVDRHIGRILQKIDDLRLWKDSVVLITSDHGASLGEHERTGKSNINEGDDRYWPIYPEVGHVPFLIAGEGIPQGARRKAIGQPVDILPTLSELAEVNLEGEKELQGRSLAPLIKGEEESGREYAVSGSYLDPEGEDGRLPSCSVTPFLVTEEWGYAPVGAEREPELYRLQNDPLAKEDLARGNDETLAELDRLFLTHLEESGAAEDFLKLWR